MAVPGDQQVQPHPAAAATSSSAPVVEAAAPPPHTVAAPVLHRQHHVVAPPLEKAPARIAPRHHAAPPVHRPVRVATLTSALHQLLSRSTLPVSAPLSPRPIAFVPAQGVTLVPPTEVPEPAASVDLKPTHSSSLPKAPTLPSAPSSPTNDAPASIAGGLGGPAGGALLLVAALAAVLLISPPWLTSRVAVAAAAPVEWRRRLSLERPG